MIKNDKISTKKGEAKRCDKGCVHTHDFVMKQILVIFLSIHAKAVQDAAEARIFGARFVSQRQATATTLANGGLTYEERKKDFKSADDCAMI